jgi:predicted amidohydrolase
MNTRKRCRVTAVTAIAVVLLLAVGCQQKAPEPVPLTVATVTMNAKTDTASNRDQFATYMTQAAEQGAHLIVFPEVALQQNPGYPNPAATNYAGFTAKPEEMAYVEDTAESIPGESTDWLVEKARELGIYVIFGMTERGDDDKLYNTSVLLGPQGTLGSYRSFVLSYSEPFYEPGSELVKVVESPLGNIGLMTGNELEYDLGRPLGEAGTDLIATVTAWPAFEHWPTKYDRTVTKTARQCACWHVVSNQVGTVGYNQDYGHSKVLNPSGEVIADTGEKEGMVVVQTDLLVDPAVLSDQE